MYIIKTENEVYGSYTDFDIALYDYFILERHNIPAKLSYSNGEPYDEAGIRYMAQLSLTRYEVGIERIKDWLKNHPE